MITLPNGDKWIIDDSELKNTVNDIVPETKIEDFLKQLLYPEEEDCFIPRKYINENGGCWDANFNAHKEILEALAVNIIHVNFFDAYEMPSGEIHVVYQHSAAHDGYDVEIGVISYPNKIEYNKAVCFKE